MVGELTSNDLGESEAEQGESLVYTHKKFSVSYNGNRIIQASSCGIHATYATR